MELEGKNVLEYLQEKHDVRISGKQLTCIDDVCAKKGFWWKFFVNDKLILSSADRYYPKNGDIILLDYGDEE
ncbi:DUF4430 domain-containing protein [Candidatus Woesearchaeota archaeon]|nr:DUF4430 domain-containing protein [Candidatus Woesearchaeota archaeon]